MRDIDLPASHVAALADKSKTFNNVIPTLKELKRIGVNLEPFTESKLLGLHLTDLIAVLICNDNERRKLIASLSPFESRVGVWEQESFIADVKDELVSEDDLHTEAKVGPQQSFDLECPMLALIPGSADFKLDIAAKVLVRDVVKPLFGRGSAGH